MDIHIVYKAKEVPEEGLWINIIAQDENSGTIRQEGLLSCTLMQAEILAKNLNEALERIRFREAFPKLLQKGLVMAS